MTKSNITETVKGSPEVTYNRTSEIYAAISSKLLAMENCERTNNTEWFDRHQTDIESIVENYMPHGSGFDNGTKLDFDASKPERLVFNTSYHHMNDGGYYDGWTSHQVIITPSLSFGFEVTVKGQNRNDIKDYIGEQFQILI